MKKPGGNFAYTRGTRYPIVVTEPTIYTGVNFTQKHPHTDIFYLSGRGLVLFNKCNLVNVSVPAGAVINGGNLGHFVRTATGNPKRPYINLLHECSKCATAVVVIRKFAAAKRSRPGRDIHGRWNHDILKRVYKERRKHPELMEADLALIRAENAAALATARGEVAGPLPSETLFSREWWATKWDSLLQAVKVR